MSKKSIFELVFLGLLVTCALVYTGITVQGIYFSNQNTNETQLEIQEVPHWDEIEWVGTRIGSEEAAIQIVEFYDYQCQYCKKAYPVLKSIQNKYSGTVSVMYVHNPLSYHEHAYSAAVAAECAGEQNLFTEFHDVLFNNQDYLGEVTYTKLAQDINVDNITRFERCIENQETAEIVNSGRELAYDVGVNGIPTFLVNNKLFSGAISEEQFDEIIKQQLSLIDLEWDFMNSYEYIK